MISIDTCRADRLSCYGNIRPTTPNIDALAREGTLFENVIAPIPNTLPSHSSMFTGTLPPYHGVHSNIAYRLRDANITVAEILRDHGYTTAGAVGAFVLDRQFGIAQGFATYDDDMGIRGPQQRTIDILNERPAEAINRFALDWIGEHADRPFFLFLHYYDAHYPYEPPEPFATRFGNARYEGEIAYVDHCIGQVFAQLKTLGLYENTLIIVTSDHGEGLGEHGESKHGYYVYHSTTRIPLVIRWPGKSKPARVKEKVALVDVAPTILSATGLPASDAMHGIDLSLYASPARRRPIGRAFFSESLAATPYGGTSLLALETQEWKYIQCAKPELYHLSVDPGELINVIDTHPEQAVRLKGRLRALLDEHTRILDDDAQTSLDAASRARLESLGYIGGKVTESISFDMTGFDPKEFHPIYEKLTSANRYVLHGQLQQARRLCEEILEQRTDVGKVYEILGRVSFESGDFIAAAEQFQKLIELDPAYPEGFNSLGNAYTRQNRWEDALASYRKAIKLAQGGGPDEGETLDRALRRLGRIDPILFEAQRNLANVLFYLQRYEEAVVEFRTMLAMDTLAGSRPTLAATRADAFYQMGMALMRLDRLDEAVQALTDALKLRPEYPEAKKALEDAQLIQTSP